jgi:hypothetical protein
MRTIETQATITEEGTLIVPVPRDLAPGPRRVVVVIDEVISSLPTKNPYTTLAEIREEFRRQGPTKLTMAEQLELDRAERDAALRGEDHDVHP